MYRIYLFDVANSSTCHAYFTSYLKTVGHYNVNEEVVLALSTKGNLIFFVEWVKSDVIKKWKKEKIE